MVCSDGVSDKMIEYMYPELRNLMLSYFHQDFDVHGDTDEVVLRQYKNVSSSDRLNRIVGELDALIALPLDGTLLRFDPSNEFDISVGQDDSEVRNWLLMAKEVLQ